MRITNTFGFFILILFITFSMSAQDKDVSAPESKETAPKEKENASDKSDLLNKDTKKSEEKIISEKKEEPEKDDTPDIVKESEDSDEIVAEKDEVNIVTEEEKSEESLPEKEKVDKTEAMEKIVKDKTVAEDKHEESVAAEKSETPVDETDLNIIVEDEDLIVEDDEEESLITEEIEEEIIPSTETAQQDEQLTDEKDTTQLKEKDTPSQEKIEDDRKVDLTPEEIETEESELVNTKEKKKEQVAVIEKTRSINFAKNQKEYRSPKKAMFFSLLLPGLGQGYARNKWKIALFGVVEAALIGFAAKNYYDGKEKKKEADRFAAAHYRINDFITFYENQKSFVVNQYLAGGKPDSLAQAKANEFIVQELYWGNDVDYYRGNLSQGELENMYEDNYFVQGWDDCEPDFDPVAGYDTTGNYKYNKDYYFDDTLKIKPFVSMYDDTTVVKGQEAIFGYSANQETYLSKVRKSNNFYDIGNVFIFVMLANHIVSAVDALITARAYNDRLLNKKSVWQHINLEQNFALSETGIQTQLGIRVRF